MLVIHVRKVCFLKFNNQYFLKSQKVEHLKR